MSKQFWGVILAIFIVFAGIVALGGGDSKQSSTNKNAPASSHVKGSTSLGITFVEYGDFECPYCGQYYPTLKQVEEKYKDKVQFQFRHFPLQNVHQNAFAASRAAEAAGLQGKFWEMHDILYVNQGAWASSQNPISVFKQYAQSIGINTKQFETDFASVKVNDTINADLAAGTKLKITGTPTFYVNGKKVEIPNSAESFDKVLQPLIEAAEKKAAAQNTTTPPATTDTTTPSN